MQWLTGAIAWEPLRVAGQSRARMEQSRDLAQEAARREAAIQQASDRAQQIPEQIARAWDGGNGQVDLVKLDHEAEQVEVEGPEDQVQDPAGSHRGVRSSGHCALGRPGAYW